MPPSTQHPSHVGTIQAALHPRRIAIESVFYEALYRAIVKTGHANAQRPGEVATLIHFFLQLPEMQEGLNAILHTARISAEIKGVFCHKAGASGPVVDFDIPSKGNGCELCDLLVLVTYGAPGAATTLGNACFLQAKVERPDLDGGASTLRQRELYEKAPTFRFRKPENYAIPSFPDNTSGHRTMPGAQTSGFCYWTFRDGRPMRGWMLNSSGITIPALISDQTKDMSFGAAMFDLMIGNLGIKVDAVIPSEFSWNRIVHDVVLRAMNEALACSSGVIAVKDVARIRHAGRALLKQALRAELALVSNPFKELAGSFESELLKHSADAYAQQKNRMHEERLHKILASGEGGDEPPIDKEREMLGDGNGGGSFIHINLSTNEGVTRTFVRKRKIKLE